MESFKENIFSKDMMEMHLEPNWSLSIPREYIYEILDRMKLSNQNGVDLFQVKEDDCNIIVK